MNDRISLIERLLSFLRPTTPRKNLCPTCGEKAGTNYGCAECLYERMDNMSAP